MNRYYSDQQDDYNYQTRRSEKYRHPEQDFTSRRFNEYGSAAHSGYGNQGSYGSYGHQDDDRRGSRYQGGNRDTYGTYSSSRNYGNMGSYGGAQGFGSTRGGYSSQRMHDDGLNHSFDSGHGSSYGYENQNQGNRGGYRGEYDSFNRNQRSDRGRDWNSEHDRLDWNSSRGNSNQSGYSNRNRDNDQRYNDDLYGTYSSRRFQDNPQHRYYEEDDYSTHSFGGDRGHGNYMGSGYNRVTRGDFSSYDGNYGSMDPFHTSNRLQDKPYGLSGYYSGGYGSERY